MRNAPQVSMPAGRSPLEAGVPLALGLLGLALTAWWSLLTWRTVQGPTLPPLAGLAAWGAYGLLCIFLARRQGGPGTGVLSWDGERWLWWPDAPQVEGEGGGPRKVVIEVGLDLQSLLLLRLRLRRPAGEVPNGPVADRWLWMTPAGDPGRWLAFRRALYSNGSRMAG